MIQSTLIDSFIKKKTSMYNLGEFIVDVSIYFSPLHHNLNGASSTRAHKIMVIHTTSKDRLGIGNVGRLVPDIVSLPPRIPLLLLLVLLLDEVVVHGKDGSLREVLLHFSGQLLQLEI